MPHFGVWQWLVRLSSILVACAWSWHASAADEPIWSALKSGGHIVLLRHAQTVDGIGDPPGFDIRQCSTQRNLNDVGRAQARAWQQAFARHNIPVGGVFSSAWCRTKETATLAFGRVDTWPALNSHFDSPDSAMLQASQVKGGLAIRMQPGKNLVLVSHQVNINAITGVSPASGEAVIARLRGDQLTVIGTLKP